MADQEGERTDSGGRVPVPKSPAGDDRSRSEAVQDSGPKELRDVVAHAVASDGGMEWTVEDMLNLIADDRVERQRVAMMMDILTKSPNTEFDLYVELHRRELTEFADEFLRDLWQFERDQPHQWDPAHPWMGRISKARWLFCSRRGPSANGGRNATYYFYVSADVSLLAGCLLVSRCLAGRSQLRIDRRRRTTLSGAEGRW